MHLTLEFINEKTKGFKPELAIVLGSGLGAFCEGLCGISIPYCDIPGFSPTKVKGHKGELLFCEIYGKKRICKKTVDGYHAENSGKNSACIAGCVPGNHQQSQNINQSNIGGIIFADVKDYKSKSRCGN